MTGMWWECEHNNSVCPSNINGLNTYMAFMIIHNQQYWTQFSDLNRPDTFAIPSLKISLILVNQIFTFFFYFNRSMQLINSSVNVFPPSKSFMSWA